MARNGKKKMTVDFAELDVYRKRLDEIGGGATERAFENALKDSRKVVAQNLTAAMAQHNETGKTAKSIIQNSPVEWTGDVASIDVGFDISDGGLPSIFLMYGTKLHGQPHITPDRNLYNAVYGAKVRKDIVKIQQQAFEKAIERALKE